jgi:hypothetical protein
MLGGDHGAPP